ATDTSKSAAASLEDKNAKVASQSKTATGGDLQQSKSEGAKEKLSPEGQSKSAVGSADKNGSKESALKTAAAGDGAKAGKSDPAKSDTAKSDAVLQSKSAAAE